MQRKIHPQRILSFPGGRKLDLSLPRVMGILNLTPDSFYDGGAYFTEQAFLAQVERMLTEGASVVDIGAVSTRPGSTPASEEEELNRLIPAIRQIRKHWPETILSVDTFRSTVASRAVESGADMINDISGGRMDELMIPAIARLRVPYVVMHMQGTPADMQVNPVYRDVVAEVKSFFGEQLNKLHHAGVTGNILLDPGFGFGKSVGHNYRLLKDLPVFTETGYPVMVGLSRKSMINRVLNTRPEDALNGTTVLNTLALLNGASLLRVHDVKEAMQAIRLVEQYQSENSGL